MNNRDTRASPIFNTFLRLARKQHTICSLGAGTSVLKEHQAAELHMERETMGPAHMDVVQGFGEKDIWKQRPT